MLQLTGIQKSFGEHHVFSIDSLHLDNGIYWLKGTNGSGKSTLLNIFAGLLPFRGEIILDKTIDIRKHPVDYRRLVNHSPAEPVYPFFLTGQELVEFIRSVKKGTHQQVDEVKEILGIDNYLLNPTGSYSSGMLKKLSLLSAFLGNPHLILLDEPLTTLDQSSQSALYRLIQKKYSEGVSFILTSHYDIEPSDIAFTRKFILTDKQLQELSGTK